MSCKECKYSPKSYEEYCIAQSNPKEYCSDAYTEKSYLCSEYNVDKSYKTERSEKE